MCDEGLLVYYQKYISKGVFGVFCKVIDDDLVDFGFVLIVENLDCFYCGKVREVMFFFFNIVNVGIIVIIVVDGCEYLQIFLDNNYF